MKTSAPLSSVALRGMTLLEILIVMLVGAILAALLFPALRSTIESSRAAKCVGNLRNYGMAASAYQQEVGNVIPYKYWTPSDTPGGPDVGGDVWYNIIAQYGVGQSKSAHTCLSAKRRYETTAPGALYGWANYGWNAEIAYKTPALLRLPNVAHPSRLFLVADTTTESPGGSSWLVQSVTTTNQVLDKTLKNNFDFRHNGRANILFFDGHVEARKPEQIPIRTSPKTPEFSDFWQGTSN